jgi:hypothetical protein
MNDQNMIEIISKFGFTGLAIFLIWYFLRESSKREDRMAAALDVANKRLAEIAESSATSMREMSQSTREMSQSVNRLTEAFQYHSDHRLK